MASGGGCDLAVMHFRPTEDWRAITTAVRSTPLVGFETMLNVHPGKLVVAEHIDKIVRISMRNSS